LSGFGGSQAAQCKWGEEAKYLLVTGFVGAVNAPGDENSTGSFRLVQEDAVRLCSNRFRSILEVLGARGSKGEEVCHYQFAVAPATGKIDAAPDCWIVLCGIGGGGVESDEKKGAACSL